ncbi:MAG TPA: hypothetical protein VL625_04030 [Patescibacteria group bacterium]|nr:hypothetical protein [Patescibacteria group bacterium]
MSSWKHIGCVTAALLPILLTGCCENPHSFIGRNFCGNCVANASLSSLTSQHFRIAANAPPQPITPESFRIAANDAAAR